MTQLQVTSMCSILISYGHQLYLSHIVSSLILTNINWYID